MTLCADATQNQLLAALPAEDRARWQAHLELVELPAGQLDTLLAGLDATGLKVDIVAAGDAAPAGTPLSLSVVGQDQPGIVREVTAVLGAIGVNIERLETTVKDGAWSGARLFTAEADLLLPTGISEADVRDALEAISAEIMVDVTVGKQP